MSEQAGICTRRGRSEHVENFFPQILQFLFRQGSETTVGRWPGWVGLRCPVFLLHAQCIQGEWVQSEWVKVAQSCLILCNPVNYRDHRILQARILEWVAFASFRGSSQPRDRAQVSRIAGGCFTSWATGEARVGTGANQVMSVCSALSPPAFQTSCFFSSAPFLATPQTWPFIPKSTLFRYCPEGNDETSCSSNNKK